MKTEKKQNELSNEEQLLLKKLEEVSSLASYCQKPPEGWICSLGKALGLSSSELAQKTLVSEQTLRLLEEETPFLQNLNQIATAFGGNFQYVCIPNHIENLKEIILTNDTPPPNDEPSFLEKFEHLPPLPQRPSQGWIQFMRLVRGMTTQQLAKKLHMHESRLLEIEKAEMLGQFFKNSLIKIVEALGCRLEYFFIPEDDFLTHNSYAEQPLIQQLISISSLSLRPPHGWIGTTRKILGIPPLQLASKLNIGQYELLNIERDEDRLLKTFNNKYLTEIAQALGCRFEYCFIPLEPVHFDQSLLRQFENYPVYNAPTNKGQLFHLRQALGVFQSQLCKKLNFGHFKMGQLEKMEAEGKIFYQYVINMVHALGCQVKYILIPEEENLKKMKPQEALFWNDLKKQTDLFSRPTEGWFCYLRNSLKMTPSELSVKIGEKEELIIHIEHDEVNNKIIKDSVLEIAQALGFRIEYIISPHNRSKQDNIFEQNISNWESVERFRKLSLLPEKPTEGWIKALRTALGLTQKEISKHTNFVQTLLTLIEKTEENGQIIHRPLEPILQMLDARAELIFIPNDLTALQNSFMKKKSPLKKPIIPKTPPKQKPFSFLIAFDQLALDQKRPAEGWIHTLRKIQGLSYSTLAKRMGCTGGYIFWIEQMEVQNKSISPHLKKVAHALGYHLDYTFIPNNLSFEGNKQQHFPKGFELPLQIFQAPPEGWVATIRKSFGLKEIELSKKINKIHNCVTVLEKREKNGNIIPQALKKIAEALNCKVELLFIPERAFFEEFTASSGHSLPAQELYKKLEIISSFYERPVGGWIYFMRRIRGKTWEQLAKEAKLSLSYLKHMIRLDAKNLLGTDNMRSIAEALGGRFEYFLISNTSLKAPLSKDLLYQFLLPPQKPAEGWIEALRLARGLSKAELAKMADISVQQLEKVEKYESQNKFIYSCLQKTAYALGGRFEYVLIPEKPFLPQDRSLVSNSCSNTHLQKSLNP